MNDILIVLLICGFVYCAVGCVIIITTLLISNGYEDDLIKDITSSYSHPIEYAIGIVELILSWPAYVGGWTRMIGGEIMKAIRRK